MWMRSEFESEQLESQNFDLEKRDWHESQINFDQVNQPTSSYLDSHEYSTWPDSAFLMWAQGGNA